MPCLPPRFSPHSRISQVPVSQIRSSLLSILNRWGKPQAVRTDNGKPFGSPQRNIIPVLSLWLYSWGILPIWNRPRRPTDNAHVENNQRTSARWAEVDQCYDIEQLQSKLDDIAQHQREHYLVTRLGNVTRKQLYKQLYDNPRSFAIEQFDAQKARQLLAQATMPRLVNKNGRISLYDKLFSVGLPFRKKVVICQYDDQSLSWICRIDQQVIKVIADPRFNDQHIFHLTVCQRTN